MTPCHGENKILPVLILGPTDAEKRRKQQHQGEMRVTTSSMESGLSGQVEETTILKAAVAVIRVNRSGPFLYNSP